jgi:type IV pilus assembly protein PilO
MTNLQEAANAEQLRWRQRLLLGVPIAAGGLVATAITGLITVPQWLGMRSSSARVQQLESLQQQVPLLRDQLLKSGLEIERNASKQRQLLRLIEGSGEFATFLAQLDLEASRHGLQLELFEPAQVPSAGAQSPPSARTNKAAEVAQPPQAPLQAAGLQAERVLLSARGPYPNLLAFMRAIEKLSLLVVPSDFSLKLVEIVRGDAGASGAAGEPKILLPELKLTLAYYQAPEGGLKPSVPPGAEQKPADANNP